MKVNLITDVNPYILDKIKTEPNLAALTRKNADFIEAVVALDSNYRVNTDPKNKDGTAYWFNQMLKYPQEYEKCLRKTIEIIDKTNSTHLEATVDGRKQMFNIIRSHCSNAEALKKAVCINPSENSYDNLFYWLCKSMRNRKGVTANNISFASKFISYARKYLNNNDVSFSKYDRVVSRKLSLYEKIYTDNKIKVIAGKFENKASKRKNLVSDIEKQKYTYAVYVKYMKAIDKILYHLEKDNNIVINKEEFDHIIWYSSKGK